MYLECIYAVTHNRCFYNKSEKNDITRTINIIICAYVHQKPKSAGDAPYDKSHMYVVTSSSYSRQWFQMYMDVLHDLPPKVCTPAKRLVSLTLFILQSQIIYFTLDGFYNVFMRELKFIRCKQTDHC